MIWYLLAILFSVGAVATIMDIRKQPPDSSNSKTLEWSEAYAGRQALRVAAGWSLAGTILIAAPGLLTGDIMFGFAALPALLMALCHWLGSRKMAQQLATQSQRAS